MVDAQTIGVLVTATSVTIAAIYYIFTLRINRNTQELALKAQQQNLETRQAQLFMPIYSTFYSDDFLRAYWGITSWSYNDYDDYISKYGPKPI